MKPPRETIEQATDRAGQLAAVLLEITGGTLTRAQFDEVCGIAGIDPRAVAAVIEGYTAREPVTH